MFCVSVFVIFLRLKVCSKVTSLVTVVVTSTNQTLWFTSSLRLSRKTSSCYLILTTRVTSSPRWFLILSLTNLCPPRIKFVQPIVDRVAVNIEPVVIDKDKYSFLDKKELARVKQSINGLIREGVELTDEVLFDVIGDNHLVNLFQLVVDLKEQFMGNCITYCGPDHTSTGNHVMVRVMFTPHCWVHSSWSIVPSSAYTPT